MALRLARLAGVTRRHVNLTAIRAASTNFSRYPFLKELGLQEENAGVFDGEWFGSGEVVTSYSPIDNEPLGRVRLVCGSQTIV